MIVLSHSFFIQFSLKGVLEFDMLEVSLFKQSYFYEKYKNSYVADKLLRDYFNDSTIGRVTSVRLKTYTDVVVWDITIMSDLLQLKKELPKITDKELWLMANKVYIDPDGKAFRKRGEVVCTADALLSFSRIYSKYGFTTRMIKEYETYRKHPIFYFPRERNGVNMTRATVFGDRIDCTLLDLKYYYTREKQCKLKSALKKVKTAKFLQTFSTFEELVDWYGIEGSFVNESYEINDLERGAGTILSDYHSDTRWQWSNQYYENVKKASEKFMAINH